MTTLREHLKTLTKNSAVGISWKSTWADAHARAFRDIGLALSAAHGTIATDLPAAEVTDTSWRVDHTHELAQLAVLEKALDAGSASSPHHLAESIGMAALTEAFRVTMLELMRAAISAGHEDTHLECLKEAQLRVQRFHACASALRQPAVSVSPPLPQARATRTLAECLQADQPIIRVALMLAREQGLSASFMTQAALPSAEDIEAELGPDLLQQARDMVGINNAHHGTTIAALDK